MIPVILNDGERFVYFEKKTTIISSHVYPTRLKRRLQNVQEKYDDIFSAVFEKSHSAECLAQINGNRQRKLVGSSIPTNRHGRSISECGSFEGVRDYSIGTISSGSQSPVSVSNEDG